MSINVKLFLQQNLSIRVKDDFFTNRVKFEIENILTIHFNSLKAEFVFVTPFFLILCQIPMLIKSVC